MIRIQGRDGVVHGMSLEVKNYIQDAERDQDFLKIHVFSRVILAGTAIAATVEVIARLTFFCFAQIGGLFTFYSSESINTFIKAQVSNGFGAAAIASASLFSILLPSFFTTLQFAAERAPHPAAQPLPVQQPQAAAPRRIVQPIREALEELRADANLIADVISLPFKILALCFQLPFYIIQFSIQLMLFPLQLMLLPCQIALMPFNLAARIRI